MATVYVNVDEYFATINPLARKISQDLENIKQSYGDDWNDFSCDQQDKELWNNLVPPEITDKYVSQTESSNEDVPSVFPKLKISCGEKIIVDFDNDDGWTWTDEHSGPFSWRSLSQQDLSLFEDEPQKDIQKARNLKATKNPKPPVSNTNQSHSFVPEKSIWSSPFLASEKSASHNVDPDTLEIFQRFGITFGGKEEEDVSSSAAGADEDSSLLSGRDTDRLQLSLNTELLTDNISDDISESTPSSVDAEMSVTSMADSKPVSPTDVASYTRDMQSYQTYFSDAYEQNHQNPVTEQPKPVSPVIPLKQPVPKPASSATPLKESKPASPVTQPKPVPKPASLVTQPEPVPKPAPPVTQPKPASPVTQSKPVPEAVLPVESSDKALSEALSSFTSQKSGFDFLDNW